MSYDIHDYLQDMEAEGYLAGEDEPEVVGVLARAIRLTKEQGLRDPSQAIFACGRGAAVMAAVRFYDMSNGEFCFAVQESTEDALAKLEVALQAARDAVKAE